MNKILREELLYCLNTFFSGMYSQAINMLEEIIRKVEPRDKRLLIPLLNYFIAIKMDAESPYYSEIIKWIRDRVEEKSDNKYILTESILLAYSFYLCGVHHGEVGDYNRARIELRRSYIILSLAQDVDFLERFGFEVYDKLKKLARMHMLYSLFLSEIFELASTLLEYINIRAVDLHEVFRNKFDILRDHYVEALYIAKELGYKAFITFLLDYWKKVLNLQKLLKMKGNVRNFLIDSEFVYFLALPLEDRKSFEGFVKIELEELHDVLNDWFVKIYFSELPAFSKLGTIFILDPNGNELLKGNLEVLLIKVKFVPPFFLIVFRSNSFPIQLFLLHHYIRIFMNYAHELKFIFYDGIEYHELKSKFIKDAIIEILRLRGYLLGDVEELSEYLLILIHEPIDVFTPNELKVISSKLVEGKDPPFYWLASEFFADEKFSKYYVEDRMIKYYEDYCVYVSSEPEYVKRELITILKLVVVFLGSIKHIERYLAKLITAVEYELTSKRKISIFRREPLRYRDIWGEVLKVATLLNMISGESFIRYTQWIKEYKEISEVLGIKRRVSEALKSITAIHKTLSEFMKKRTEKREKILSWLIGSLGVLLGLREIQGLFGPEINRIINLAFALLTLIISGLMVYLFISQE